MYDVVIVGAGPGGATAAHYLAQSGLDVLLLDKAAFPRDKTCGDGLTPRALTILQNMGLLEELKRVGCRINRLEVAAPNGSVISAPFPKTAAGINYSLIVPRLLLDNIIRQKALASGANFEDSVHVTDLIQETNGISLKGEQNGTSVLFQGRTVILATGANIGLLRNLGLLKQIPPMLTAARTYYEGISGLAADAIQVRFENVPPPGYGWVFPISPTAANIGVMLHPSATRQTRLNSRAAFENFLHTPAVRKLLRGAEQSGPVKGYPLYTAFGATPTFDRRLLVVGEAAGLVNPITGDGTDFALVSGRLAARLLARRFATTGDFSRRSLQSYDVALRQRFERLFSLSRQARNWLDKPLVFNQMMRGAALFPALNPLIVDLLLG